jgi:hypothetical protein
MSANDKKKLLIEYITHVINHIKLNNKVIEQLIFITTFLL